MGFPELIFPIRVHLRSFAVSPRFGIPPFTRVDASRRPGRVSTPFALTGPGPARIQSNGNRPVEPDALRANTAPHRAHADAGARCSPEALAELRIGIPVGREDLDIAPLDHEEDGGPEAAPPGGDQVFVIEPDKNGKTRAHVRQVEGGAMIGDEVVIHAGLSAGERVAVSGSFKLRGAALVAIAGTPEDGSESGQVIVGER